MITLFGRTWNIDGPWGAPGNGMFQPSNVFVAGGALVLRMTQTQVNSGIVSSDAEVCSVDKFGYGTFEFTAAVDPVQSGQVASGFLYFNNSETEIDVELAGDAPSTVWVTNYSGVTNKQYTEVPNVPHSAFHRYAITWLPGHIGFSVDGVLVAPHTQFVPTAPAYFLFNFWGTNSKSWGGLATLGTRYMFVTDFKFTPF